MITPSQPTQLIYWVLEPSERVTSGLHPFFQYIFNKIVLPMYIISPIGYAQLCAFWFGLYSFLCRYTFLFIMAQFVQLFFIYMMITHSFILWGSMWSLILLVINAIDYKYFKIGEYYKDRYIFHGTETELRTHLAFQGLELKTQ